MALSIASFNALASTCAGIAMACFGAWYYTHDTPPNRAASDLANIRLDMKKEDTKQMEIAAKSGKVVSFTSDAAIASSSSETAVLNTFPCDTPEKQTAGYALGDVQAVFKAETEYRFPQGCALVRVDTYVHSLRGGRYLFSERGVNHGCGTLSGRNDSPEDCVNFLNSHHGQVLELANGSNLIIN